MDGAGNVYIADTFNNAIEKWSAATGTLTTLVALGLASPAGVGVDAAGNVYIADTYNNVIKEWNQITGTVSTVVSGLSLPQSVALDAAGNIYFTDHNNYIKEWAQRRTPSPL